jgi:predicted glycosyltransferase involved in capsule biosynthesis
MLKTLDKSSLKDMSKGSFTVIVPFREQLEQKRGEQLTKFTDHFQKLGYSLLIVEQNEGKKFNRGKLLNIGADLVETDYMIFHDVDLLPKPNIIPYYEVLPTHPIHIGGAWQTKYNGPGFFGGVVSISKKDFKTINGFPNNYWGWGGEDDAMFFRLYKSGIPIYKPTIRSGFTELVHVDTRSNPEWKNMRRWEDLKEEKEGNPSGLKDLDYRILTETEINPFALKITVDL